MSRGATRGLEMRHRSAHTLDKALGRKVKERVFGLMKKNPHLKGEWFPGRSCFCQQQDILSQDE